MVRRHSPDGFKGARHLSQRDLPIVSVIPSALSSIDIFSHPKSEGPVSGSDLPTFSVPLPPDEPPSSTSVAIPGFPLPPLLSSLLPSDTATSLVSIKSSSTPLTTSTSSVFTSQPPSTTTGSSNAVNSTAEPPSPSSTAHSTPSSTSITSQASSTPAAFANTGSSTITEVFTTTSGTIALEVTTTIPPSLVSNPGSESSFFKDKGQAAAVLTIGILVGILGFSFLGYRFVKTVKIRQLERDLQEASRLNRSRALLADGEDDAFSADYNMRQTDSSLWNDPSVNSDRRVGSTKSGSTVRSDQGVGYTSFERAARGRFSSEEDEVSPANTNESAFKGPTSGLDSSSNLVAASSSSGPAVSVPSRNPFLVRREDIEPPTPPVLPDFFGEDPPTLNAISSPASIDDRNAFYLRQQNLKAGDNTFIK